MRDGVILVTVPDSSSLCKALATLLDFGFVIRTRSPVSKLSVDGAVDLGLALAAACLDCGSVAGVSIPCARDNSLSNYSCSMFKSRSLLMMSSMDLVMYSC